MSEIKLGRKVRCIVTGFEGIATAKVERLSGNVQYAVQPHQKDDGIYQYEQWIDAKQLKVVGEGVTVDSEGNLHECSAEC